MKIFFITSSCIAIIVFAISAYLLELGLPNYTHRSQRLYFTVYYNYELWQHIRKNKTEILKRGINIYFEQQELNFCEELTEAAFQLDIISCRVVTKSTPVEKWGGFYIDEEDWIPRVNIKQYPSTTTIRQRSELFHFMTPKMSDFPLLDTDPHEWVNCEIATKSEYNETVRELALKMCEKK